MRIMPFALAGASALAGAATMYYIMESKKKTRISQLEAGLEEQYAQNKKQVDDIARLIKRIEQNLPPDNQDRVEDIPAEVFDEVREELTGMPNRETKPASKTTHFIDYSKVKYSDDVRKQLGLPPEVPEKVKFSDTEHDLRGPTHFVISLDEFDQNDDYEKAWLTYYAEDDYLLVDDEHIPMTPQEIETDIKIDFRNMFGVESADDDEVYIRNKVEMCDFQIKRVHSALEYYEVTTHE